MKRVFSLNSTWFRTILSLLRLVAVPIAVGWVIVVLLRESPDLKLSISFIWLVASLITIQLALWVVSLRITQLMAIYEIAIPTLAAFKINLRSMFYFLVLPTQAGMEAVRFFGIRRASPKADNTKTATILLLDRLIGALAAAILCGLAAIRVLPGHLNSFLFSYQTWHVVVFSGCVLGLIVATYLLRSRLMGFADKILTVLKPLVHARRRLFIILIWAVLAHTLFISSVAFALYGIGISVPIDALAFAIMGGNFLMLIPISFAGIGAAELAGVVLLIAVGVPESAAAAAIFVTYLTRVIAGLQGAAIEIWAGGISLRALNVAPTAEDENSSSVDKIKLGER